MYKYSKDLRLFKHGRQTIISRKRKIVHFLFNFLTPLPFKLSVSSLDHISGNHLEGGRKKMKQSSKLYNRFPFHIALVRRSTFSTHTAQSSIHSYTSSTSMAFREMFWLYMCEKLFRIVFFTLYNQILTCVCWYPYKQ